MPRSLTLPRPLLAFAAALMLALLPACGALSQSTSLGKASGSSGTGPASAFSGIDFENTTIANFDRCPHMDEPETLRVKNGNGTVDVEIYYPYDVDEETYDVFVPGNTEKPLFVKLGDPAQEIAIVSFECAFPAADQTYEQGYLALGIVDGEVTQLGALSSANYRERYSTTGGDSKGFERFEIVSTEGGEILMKEKSPDPRNFYPDGRPPIILGGESDPYTAFSRWSLNDEGTKVVRTGRADTLEELKAHSPSEDNHARLCGRWGNSDEYEWNARENGEDACQASSTITLNGNPACKEISLGPSSKEFALMQCEVLESTFAMGTDGVPVTFDAVSVSAEDMTDVSSTMEGEPSFAFTNGHGILCTMYPNDHFNEPSADCERVGDPDPVASFSYNISGGEVSSNDEVPEVQNSYRIDVNSVKTLEVGTAVRYGGIACTANDDDKSITCIHGVSGEWFTIGPSGNNSSAGNEPG